VSQVGYSRNTVPIETVRSGADREAAWASEGLRAAFADLMTKKPTRESEKPAWHPSDAEKRAVCKKSKRASGTAGSSPGRAQSAVKVRQTQVRRSSTGGLREQGEDTHDEPLGAVAGYIIWQRFGTLVYRYKGRTGCPRYDADASRLACSGRAWHSARGGSGGKAKAGRQAVGVEMPCGQRECPTRACFGSFGWSEREFWVQSPSMAALCHQASTGEEEQVSAAGCNGRRLCELTAEGKSREIKHPERADRIQAKSCMGGLFDSKAPPSWRTDSSGFNGSIANKSTNSTNRW